jgi:hypothetical protein
MTGFGLVAIIFVLIVLPNGWNWRCGPSLTMLFLFFMLYGFHEELGVFGPLTW